MIVLIGGEKGGTGKTTLASNLAQMRTARGNDVLLVDTDVQNSSYDWANLRQENEIAPSIKKVSKLGKNITADLQDLSQRYDELIIDSGGRDTHELRASLAVADLLFVPIQASQLDIWTLDKMESLIDQIKIINSKLKSYIVLNRASTNPSVKESEEAKEILSDIDNIEYSNIVIRDRIAFRKAMNEGLGVEELRSDKKAIQEIASLYNFIYNQ